MSVTKKYYEIKQCTENFNHNFGVWYAVDEQHAMLRLLHTKGINATLADGELLWPNSLVKSVWMDECTWTIKEC